MIKAMVVASFQYKLDSEFGGNSSPVLTNLNKIEKWEGLDVSHTEQRNIHIIITSAQEVDNRALTILGGNPFLRAKWG